MKQLQKIVILVIAFSFFAALATPKESHAVSKKVIMMYKAAGYGAAAGLLVGAATWTMGVGSAKNMMVGTSLGLYGGLIFGTYILLSQKDNSDELRRQNPYKPGTPVGPDDWEDEPEDTLQHSMVKPELRGSTPVTLIGQNTLKPKTEAAAWIPVYSLSF